MSFICQQKNVCTQTFLQPVREWNTGRSSESWGMLLSTSTTPPSCPPPPFECSGPWVPTLPSVPSLSDRTPNSAQAPKSFFKGNSTFFKRFDTFKLSGVIWNGVELEFLYCNVETLHACLSGFEKYTKNVIKCKTVFQTLSSMITCNREGAFKDIENHLCETFCGILT